jgi:hypothetical protein
MSAPNYNPNRMGTPAEGGDKPKKIPLKVTLGSPKDLPILYAHQVIVNFTGNEFYVTIYRTAPEPWTAGGAPNPDVEAQPLARFAFAPLMWLAAVEACSDQIRKLHAEGNISDDLLATVKKAMLGQ